MSKYKTYYGFDYDKVSAVMLRHVPTILREIEFMTDGIMNSHDYEFVSDDMSDTGQAYYPDRARHKEATLETTRLLISWLFNCLPPVLNEQRGEYFILPDELTIEHAQAHFAEMASNGYDHNERRREELFDKYEDLPWDDAIKAIQAELKADREAVSND